MGKMSDVHIILSGLADDGVDSGYFGNRLKEYVTDEATSNYRISASFIEPFLESELAECEEGIYND